MTKQSNNKKCVCIDIDHNLKEEFERLTSFHQRTYEEALEAGIKAAIYLAQDPDTIKRKINRTEQELHNLWEQLESAVDQNLTEEDKSDFRWE